MKLFATTATALVAVSIAAALSCGPPKRPDGGAGLLPVGASAPDVEGKDAQARTLRLSQVRGHAAVVYFYPKDETPGCTKEACAFRDAFVRYEAAHVTIFAVSRDSEASHRAFTASHHLPFPLVSDESGSVQASYGVPSFLGMTSRVSFLIGKDGKVARVWPDVDPGVHADEVLAAASEAEARSP